MSQVSISLPSASGLCQSICSFPSMTTEIDFNNHNPCIPNIMNLITTQCNPEWWNKNEMLDSIRNIALKCHPDKCPGISSSSAWFRMCMEARELIVKIDNYRCGHILAENKLYYDLGCCSNHLIEQNDTNQTWKQFLILLAYHSNNETLQKIDTLGVQLNSHSDAINFIATQYNRILETQGRKFQEFRLPSTPNNPYEMNIEHKDFDTTIFRTFAYSLLYWIFTFPKFKERFVIGDLPFYFDSLYGDKNEVKNRMVYANRLVKRLTEH